MKKTLVLVLVHEVIHRVTERILKLSLDRAIVIHDVISVFEIDIYGDLLINKLVAFYFDVIADNIFVHDSDWIGLTEKL